VLFIKEQQFDEIMRPKIVILILGIGVGLVAVVVLLKGLTGRHAGDVGGQTPAVEASAGSPPATTNQAVKDVQVNPAANTVAGSEEMRAAAVEKELDAIRELLGEADGTNNSTIISALLAKVANPAADVRQAALEALKQLNDTNAVAGLEQAAEAIKDPRQKVAVLDVIDYLNLPSVTPDGPSDYATNDVSVAAISTNLNMNSKFLHKANRHGTASNNGRQMVPPNAPANQPQ
jgi:hypothetical protein